jgi:hypothetical protein
MMMYEPVIDMLFVAIFIMWLLAAGFLGLLASVSGRSVGKWMLAGLLLGLLAVLIYAVQAWEDESYARHQATLKAARSAEAV